MIKHLAVGLMALASLAVQADDTAYDVVIRHGRVLDGAGNPWVPADVAIKGGIIVKVGEVPGKGAREIDAAGKYVSPGWIDMMDQSGEVLLKVGLAPNKINMGVTTLIGGEGGTPVEADAIDAYFSDLETKGISVNFGTYYSATQARVAVLGDSDIDPTPAQLEEMKKRVGTAMDAGAMGITTALIYPPSSFHKTDNLIELARVAGAKGGLYASHIRGESAEFLDAVREAIRIGEEGGAGVEIFHLKAAYYPNWGKDMKTALGLIDAARARGVNVAADLYPYVAGGTGLEVTAPSWVYADGIEKAVERLKDPDVRAGLKKEIAAGPQKGWTNLVYVSGGWKNVVLANSHLEEYARFHNRNFQEIGAALGRDPADVAWDIMLEAYPKRPFALYFMMSEDDVRLAMQAPWVSIGSDAASAMKEGDFDALGLPHPRSYGTFPRIIAKYVRDEGVLSLENAIRKLTSWPAARMGLMDRGLIREGLKADITVFDLGAINDTATWENPTAKPTGIDYVLVNGSLVLDAGHHTGATPGKVLRGPGYKPGHGQTTAVNKD
ncbi:N-acyl-D-amino-acid deacylase family protein [Kordiimonas aestuarii]|uniref:N-acyl-D-amino-acid deacylase family protein n=1 Tax=Kordiimonas aestuarii TaxID=1005925 RepID=UPI0021D1FBC7|nr:D-aminoacylase [Kordiimonas aestuarii]